MPSSAENSAHNISEQIIQKYSGTGRMLVALAGPPASGKSTLAELVVKNINNHQDGYSSELLPMDGFHLDNRILTKQGLLKRKGAPQTFDALGFHAFVDRIKKGDEDVVHPIFDRSQEIAIAGAGIIDKTKQIIVIEGNYLLLNSHPWNQLKQKFDLSIFLDTPYELLEKRLLERWTSYGFDEDTAKIRVNENDLPNAKLILEQSMPADIVITNV